MPAGSRQRLTPPLADRLSTGSCSVQLVNQQKNRVTIILFEKTGDEMFIRPFIPQSIMGLVLLAAMGLDTAAQENTSAVIRLNAGKVIGPPIPKFLTGQFCEHLGTNIYHGMDAQILRNPTFADYPFWNGQMTPDGATAFHHNSEQIGKVLQQQAKRFGWPESERDRLVEAREDALACWWIREGSRQNVQVSPDTAGNGNRAQRVQVSQAGEGFAQWTYLPLHRVKKFEYEIVA